jgi:hypothetical protein
MECEKNKIWKKTNYRTQLSIGEGSNELCEDFEKMTKYGDGEERELENELSVGGGGRREGNVR